MPSDDRIKVINQAAGLAEEVIIADFNVPQPKKLKGVSCTTSEFMAGLGHFRNYLAFISRGGIGALIGECNLKIEQEARDRTGKYIVVKASHA